jgi:hypothetical protein
MRAKVAVVGITSVLVVVGTCMAVGEKSRPSEPAVRTGMSVIFLEPGETQTVPHGLKKRALSSRGSSDVFEMSDVDRRSFRLKGKAAGSALIKIECEDGTSERFVVIVDRELANTVMSSHWSEK